MVEILKKAQDKKIYLKEAAKKCLLKNYFATFNQLELREKKFE
jgi:hypothetical protein